MSDITLWFGDTGTRLDQYGNVYSVSRGKASHKNPDKLDADLVSIYQSILKECGIKVSIEDFRSPSPYSSDVVHRVIHTVISTGGWLPCFRKEFGYEYIDK
jgi:hypothetical protein